MIVEEASRCSTQIPPIRQTYLLQLTTLHNLHLPRRREVSPAWENLADSCYLEQSTMT